MPYTVAYSEAGIKRKEFDAYVRLLEKRGIDWTRAPRTPEPGTPNRWLYVWENREDADAFCAELQGETRDQKWYVRNLPDLLEASSGTLTPVIVLMRRNSLGAEFSLHPHSRALVRRRFPTARMVNSVSIETETLDDFQQQHGPIWEHVAQVLSGLDAASLTEVGGFRIVDSASDQIVFEAVNVTPCA